MIKKLEKTWPFISIPLIFVLVASLFYWKSATRVMSMILIGLSVVVALVFVIQKQFWVQKQGKISLAVMWHNIIVDVLGIFITMAAVILVACKAGAYVGQAAGRVWGETAGILSSLTAGLVAGFASPFLPQKPEGINHVIITLPAGVRKVVLGDGTTTQWVVSDLDPAWGMDSDGNLLPQEFFVGQGDSPTLTFRQKVNNLLGYDAVQHPDHVNGVILKPGDVPFDTLFEPVILMNSNGYVGSSETMLDSLLDYNPNGAAIIRRIVEVAPPDAAQRIIDFLAGRWMP